jgi:hypothetical protein
MVSSSSAIPRLGISRGKIQLIQREEDTRACGSRRYDYDGSNLAIETSVVFPSPVWIE